MITDATGTDVWFVYVLDDSDRSLTLAGATPPFDQQVGRIRLPLGSGISGWVASHRRPVVITEDKESDARYVPIEALSDSVFTSMVSVPMQTDPGGLVGELTVHTVERREFTPGDVELLSVIGRLIAGALHQASSRRTDTAACTSRTVCGSEEFQRCSITRCSSSPNSFHLGIAVLLHR